MPLLNYTTSVEAAKTVAQIQDILAKHGANSILINYDDDGQIKELSFQVNTSAGNISIRLPVIPDAVLRVMQQQKKIPRHYANRTQAIRVAWRIVKDWVEAQMAILETEMVKLEQVFLPYVIISGGQTLFEHMVESRFQITQGEQL